MKKLQRILMALALCSLSIGAVGCSSNSKMSNEELVKKIDESSKSVKNSKSKVESKLSVNLSGKSIVTTVTMDAEATEDPFVVKVDGKVETGGKSRDINMYMLGEKIYIKNIYNQWVPAKDANLRKAFEDRKNIAKFDNMVELLKFVEKNLNVEEKGSNYEVTYSGVDDSAKEALKKMIISNQPDAEKVLKNMEIEKLDIKYVVDKNTFYPTEFEMKSVMKVSEGNQSVSFDMEMKVKYSDINKVKEIVIPDEVKNAKETKAK